MPPNIYPGERVDDLQLNGLRIIQHPKRFCFGMDAVRLSNFAAAGKNDRVLDLCTGTGVIPLLMSEKTQAQHFTGLELQPESADMARRSVTLNGLDERIRIDAGDLREAVARYGASSFDVITVNPPYMKLGVRNAREEQALARHEIACTLEDVVSVSARLLKTGGRMYMVHRPHRLVDVFYTLRDCNLEPKTLQLVQARADKAPSLALIEAALDGKPWLKILPTIMSGSYDIGVSF